MNYLKLLLWLSMRSIFINVSFVLWNRICVLVVWNFIFIQYLNFVNLVVHIFSILIIFDLVGLFDLVSFSPYNCANFYFLYFWLFLALSFNPLPPTSVSFHPFCTQGIKTQSPFYEDWALSFTHSFHLSKPHP